MGIEGHPIFLLSSRKFVHNDFNGLAISAFLTAHLSCQLLADEPFHIVGESLTYWRIRTSALSVSGMHKWPPIILYPGCMILVRGPVIVPHEVICPLRPYAGSLADSNLSILTLCNQDQTSPSSSLMSTQ